MQILLLVLHIILVVLNTYLSIFNFKNGDTMIGVLWATTVPLWMINVVADIIKLSC